MGNSKGYKVSSEIKSEILKKIKEGGTTVSEIAEQYGINRKTIYNWLTQGTSSNPSWQEVGRLKKENKALLWGN